MNTKEYIKLCMSKKNITLTKLAELVGQTQPNLSTKMARGTFYSDDLEKFANAMGAELDIRFIDKETGTPIIPGAFDSPTSPTESEETSDCSVLSEKLRKTIERSNELLEKVVQRLDLQAKLAQVLAPVT